MTEKKVEAQCILGHGKCPENCGNHRFAEKITLRMGPEWVAENSRLLILFMDQDPRFSVVDIARLLSRCAKEDKNPSTDETSNSS